MWPDGVDKLGLFFLVIVEDGVYMISSTSQIKGGVRLTERLIAICLNLAVRPSRNLDVHVDNVLLRSVRIQRNVMPEGDGVSVFFEPYSPVLAQLIHVCNTKQPDLREYCESRPRAACNPPGQSPPAKTW